MKRGQTKMMSLTEQDSRSKATSIYCKLWLFLMKNKYIMLAKMHPQKKFFFLFLVLLREMRMRGWIQVFIFFVFGGYQGNEEVRWVQKFPAQPRLEKLLLRPSASCKKLLSEVTLDAGVWVDCECMKFVAAGWYTGKFEDTLRIKDLRLKQLMKYFLCDDWGILLSERVQKERVHMFLELV